MTYIACCFFESTPRKKNLSTYERYDILYLAGEQMNKESFDMNENFSKLRELLSNPVQDHEWNEDFCCLLQETYEEREEEYKEVWVPYCEKHAQVVKEPIKSLRSLKELEEWGRMAPFATFSLHLSGNNIGDEGCEAIANSRSLANLQTLILSHNSIGDEGCKAIANSSNLTNLQTLGLLSNSIGVEGWKVIANSSNLKSLQAIKLSFYEIGDEGSLAFVCSITLPEHIRKEFMSEVKKESLIEKAREYEIHEEFDRLGKEEIAEFIWKARKEQENLW